MPVHQISKNYKIEYKMIEGQSERPYLVFLHEGLGCISMWKDFPDDLCRQTGCPGIVYDRLGYGNSSPLINPRTVHYMHHYGLYELPAMIDALIPGEPFVLIGHSDGGSISLIYAAERPPLLKGVIAEAAHVFVEEMTIAGIKEAVDAWDRGELSGLHKYHGDKTEDMFHAWSDTWCSTWFRQWNIEYLLKSVDVPLLLIQGRDDQYGSSAQVRAIELNSSGKADVKLVDSCGHTPHLEQSDVTLGFMADFINKIN